MDLEWSNLFNRFCLLYQATQIETFLCDGAHDGLVSFDCFSLRRL
jgi:hypothetical protein